MTPSRPYVGATARHVKISARKARLVVDLVRGRSVPEARTILAFTPRAASHDVAKVLNSAVANAEANHGWTGDELVISAAYVDEGVTQKRWQQRARGRVNQILKRSCHITIKLEQGTRPAPGKGGSAGASKARRIRRKKEVAA